MEKDSKDMTAVEGNTDSPCSALLERLRNLRRWQDEQRKEISLNQSGDGFAVQSPKVKEFPQDVALNDKEASQLDNPGVLNDKNYDQGSKSREEEFTASSSEFFQPSDGSSDALSPRSLTGNLSSVDGQPCRVDKHSQEEIFRQNISQDNTNDGVSSKFNPTLPLQHENKQLETSENSLRTVVQSQEHLTIDNADTKKSIACESSSESRINDLKLKPQNEDDFKRKFQGLTNFISRHVVTNSVTDNNVHILGFNLKASNENSVSQSHPKFTYLKKGQGTARFGMKPLRLRKAEHSTQGEEEREMHNGYQSSELKSNTTSQNYMLKAGMPVKTLQLQEDHKSRSGCEKFREGAVMQASAEKNEPVMVTESDFQQKRITSISESDKQRRKELEELSAFEKLEELAEDSSFSSNSSTVIRLLQRGLWSSSSTPMKSPIPSPCFSPQFQLSKRESTNILSNQRDFQQNQFPLVNVGVVLEQLKKLVRLEDLPISGLSEEDLKSILESFVESENSFNVGSASCFENNIKLTSSNPTSTPAVYEGAVVDRPRVHFQPEGVQVLEYELLESDEENTLTDMASIADDTDLVTTSDLEVLTQMSLDADKGLKEKQSLNEFRKEQNEGAISKKIINKTPIHVSSSEALQPTRLQFSPPSRPKNSASHYIWSIFGKEETKKKAQQSKTLLQVSSKEVRSTMPNVLESVQEQDGQNLKDSGNKNMKNIEGRELFPSAKRIETHEEVDTHKALLMAKVCELEKEIDFYKKGNTKIKNLQESLENEKFQLDQQRRAFQEEMAKEKVKFQEYLDCERNKLWKEKQSAKQQSPSMASSREQSMEVIFLKEQLKDLQEELKKKENLHDAAMKKLDEKIRLQEQELKSLKLRNASLQKSIKDNSQQNQKVERGNINKKPLTNNKPVALPTLKPKMKKKTATISSINRSLDKVPIIINDPLRGKQDLMSDLPVHNKIVSSGKQTRSSPVHQEDCNSGKKNSLQSFQQTNRTESVGRTIIPDKNKNTQESNIAAVTDKKEDFNGFRGVSCENQSATNDDKVKENSAVKNIPGFFSSKVQPSVPYEMEMSPQSQQSINVESTEICLDDGTREIIYANGNKKSIYSDGTIIVNYYNGDKKEIRQDRTVYVYGTDRTSHTTFVNGKEVLEFPNGQKETRFSDGSSEIIFPDKTRKTVLPDGTEVCTLPNGTIVHTNAEGFKVMEFVSGQKEVHTPEQKRREYPDGTVKILHSDGRTETRYKTGRVRIKDREGNILSDSHQSVQLNHR